MEGRCPGLGGYRVRCGAAATDCPKEELYGKDGMIDLGKTKYSISSQHSSGIVQASSTGKTQRVFIKQAQKQATDQFMCI